jgi:hypothetical protein
LRIAGCAVLLLLTVLAIGHVVAPAAKSPAGSPPVARVGTATMPATTASATELQLPLSVPEQGDEVQSSASSAEIASPGAARRTVSPSPRVVTVARPKQATAVAGSTTMQDAACRATDAEAQPASEGENRGCPTQGAVALALAVQSPAMAGAMASDAAGNKGTAAVLDAPHATQVLDATPLSVLPIRLAVVTPISGPHPRMLLDAATLGRLRASAAANTAEWRSLKAACDSYTGGTVNYPMDAPYPNLPNVGQGYQGDVYFPSLMNAALCYQVLLPTNSALATTYGNKAVDILLKMAAPFSTGSGNQGQDPMTDDGYGIRYYGVGYGLAYDWLYALMTTAQRTQVYTTANVWLAAFEDPQGKAAYAFAHPQSNYYAGYFHAKAAIAIATYGDNPSAPTQWDNWLNTQFIQRVQPYYAQHLLGGGWPEGFGNYGPKGILNMSLPMRETKTATGQDLVHAAASYTYPLDSADYAMHFTWPSRSYFDDRDTNHEVSTDQPAGTTQTGMFVQILGALNYWGSSKAPIFQQYLNDVRTATSNYAAADPWLLFLETVPGAATVPVNGLPLSYFAQGMNAVAARSDWTTSASWMSFRAGPYVNNPDQSEEGFDQGSLALVRGNSPLLVNATGWLVHNPNGADDETLLYDDLFNDGDGTVYHGNRQLYNVFYVRNMSGSTVLDRYGQGAYDVEDDHVRTKVAAYEDGINYVYVLATNLEDMYFRFSAGPGVSAWSRQIVYLRPNRFVVYDRTTAGSTGYDQFLAWHFPAAPVAGSAASGQGRFDVTYGGNYVGAMTTVLPAGTTATTLPIYPGSNPTKVWQLQVRPPSTAASQKWLTVFDLSSSSAAVAAITPVTVTQGAALGVRLAASDGNNVVISSSGAAGATIAGAVAYTVPVAVSQHVVTDLTANAGYNIVVSTSGATQTITVSPGGTYVSSAKGILDFYVNAGGTVQQIKPIISRLPVSSMPVAGTPSPYKP